jgi:hypothetical protein
MAAVTIRCDDWNCTKERGVTVATDFEKLEQKY